MATGLEVYRTCKKPEMATEGTVKLFNKYSVLSRSDQSNDVLFGKMLNRAVVMSMEISVY